MTSFFDTKIERLRGVYPPQKAELLNTELQIFTYGDLLEHYPFRHEDRTSFQRINELREDMPAAQIKGRLRTFGRMGEGNKERLVAEFTDGTGTIELAWFQSLTWVEKTLRVNGEYIVYGKPNAFNGRFQITHPEIDVITPENINGGGFQPIYPLTEKLRRKYIDSKQISKWMRTLLIAGQEI
ncbi:MAG: OB-fold nucleic acid binding domain-containing protein [Spirosomaceae bacterium]|nr:OB-fold nucleic acid binding domain-containing protein [Spirosomataceae bacterium]